MPKAPKFDLCVTKLRRIYVGEKLWMAFLLKAIQKSLFGPDVYARL